MVGRIKMKLGVQVGLGPGHIVLDGDPAPPLPNEGRAPNFWLQTSHNVDITGLSKGHISVLLEARVTMLVVLYVLCLLIWPWPDPRSRSRGDDVVCPVCNVGVLWPNTWCGPSANLQCRSELCCMQLAGNAGPKKSPKIRHLATITQLCWATSSQLRHVSTIGKKLVKQQYLSHTSSQYGELRFSSGWDRFVSFGHPS